MNEKILIAPSILSADFASLGEDIKAVDKAGCDWIHVDVMDGSFVPNITIGPAVVKALRPFTKKIMDVHLMINNPAKHIDAFCDAGSDIITFHVEAVSDPMSVINKIKSRGVKAGVSIKPGTETSVLEGILGEVDMVLIMTVEPGFGGQSFMGDMVGKIAEIKKEFNGFIQIDGGINSETAKVVIEAGANVLVAGTAVFGKDDYAKAIKGLRG